MPAEIVDIQSRSNDGFLVADIPDQIINGLSKPPGYKNMPTMLLYDERGLKLYDDITIAASEYYLFSAEEEILKDNAEDIAQTMHHGAEVTSDEVVVELGAGALRKTSHVLLGISRLVVDSGSITYYALDLERHELERTLGEISKSDVGKKLAGKVHTKGMWGTFYDGLKFIEDGGLLAQNVAMPAENSKSNMDDSPPISPTSSDSSCSETSSDSSSSGSSSNILGTQLPLHLIFLGSSLGNFSRTGAVSFLRSLPLRPGSTDTLLLGLDHDNDKVLIEEAYNDTTGYTKRFIFNGLKAAGRALGDENMFEENKFDYVNSYNTAERRHEAYYKSKCSQSVREPRSQRDIIFLKDELTKIEESFKFSEEDAYSLFTDAHLRPIQRWTDKKAQYSVWLLERPPFQFPLISSPFTSDGKAWVGTSSSILGIPSRAQWHDVWALWDFITNKMIPPSILFQKPIDLRHICLFYLGHIPTFLDIHLSNLLHVPNTEPIGFKRIFERGIDPNVDDPSQCHSHSQVPTRHDEWPSQTKILEFQEKVRAKLMKLYDDIEAGKITLTRKIARVLLMTLEHDAMHAETLLYMLIQRAGSGTIPPPGFATPHWSSLAVGWNKSPKCVSDTVVLGPACVTLGHDDAEADDENSKEVESHEFGWDNEHPKRQVHVEAFKIEWRPVTNGDFYRYYLKSGKTDVHCPASWIEDSEGMKVRTLYGPVSMEIAQNWPVIAPYDSLSTYATVKGGRLPTEAELSLFYDRFKAGYEGGANVGFRNWHPIPATTGSERSGGKGCNGGVWEWTSTVFEKIEGFEPSKVYPGYSMDFFDGKHHVVLGGSYATIPRLSERKSFRNWFQRNYPYAWVGGRIVYDIPK